MFLNKIRFLFLLAFLLVGSVAFGQKKITVKGTVVDAATNEPLSFATVIFAGTTIGTQTDLDGEYEITTEWGTDTLGANYLGYDDQFIVINPDDKNQRVNFALSETINETITVVVYGEDSKYDKNGPAVQLFEKVIDAAPNNRPKKYDYFEYDKYEKVQFDLNNISKKFKNRKAFKPFKFIFEYADTSDFTGKTALPIYIREAASKVYYRKKPEAQKEFREGIKITSIEGLVSEDAFNVITDVLYRDIDIYEDQILIFDKQFLSPLAGGLAKASYRYYIIDTLEVNNHEVIRLDFTTKKTNTEPVFNGSLYVKNDSTYAVVKADLTVPKGINLNFVNDLQMTQEFRQEEDVWILEKDLVAIDFSPLKKGKGLGMIANRSVLYENHLANVKREKDKYEGSEKVVDAKDVFKRSDEFWSEARLEELSDKELGVYEMIDTLQKVPAFKRITNILALAFSGYQPVGPVDIGPIAAFYSFNPVEGLRLRFGGQTNLNFSKKIQLEGYGAYGFEDERWKYAGAIRYSFREDFRSNPQHYIRLAYQHDTKFVGSQLRFVQEDNFLLSFKRGVNDRMLFLDRYSAEYGLEFKNNLSFKLGFDHLKQEALGSINFKTGEEDVAPVDFLYNSEFNGEIRFAPNEQFIQGRNYRTPIFNKYPVITLNYALGVDGLGGDNSYQKVQIHAFKRFYLSIFGNMRIEAEAGRIFADKLPYFFLKFPRANQSYIYRTGAFNMMNFMEFANDKWASVIMEHFFEGFFLNKIPLIKRLKLREVVSFKAVYGGLDDENNPNKNPELIQFIRKESTGEPITYLLDQKPYMEASAGLYNIFKFGRVDFVQRLNYLDNPDVPDLFGVKGLGVRVKVSVKF